MFPLRTLALAVRAALLTGWVVAPDYHRPEAPLLKRYQVQSAVQLGSAALPTSFAVWWGGFDDP